MGIIEGLKEGDAIITCAGRNLAYLNGRWVVWYFDTETDTRKYLVKTEDQEVAWQALAGEDIVPAEAVECPIEM